MFEDAEDLAGFFDIEDGFALSATYKAGGVGSGVEIPVIPSRPDQEGSLFGVETVRTQGGFKLRVSDVATPANGDTLTISGTIYTVQGEPRRDDTRTIWSIEAREG